MAIAFDTIPNILNAPATVVEFDNSRAVQGVQLQPHDVLLAGQGDGTGSATPGVIYGVATVAEADALFGVNSQLRQMVSAYKSVDALTPVYCCQCAADSGTQATGDFTYAGTATEDGEIPHYIGGRRFTVSVTSGDTAADVETSAVAAAALLTDMGVTFAAGAGTSLDLTAVQEGTIGNQIMLGVALLPGERVPAGLTVTPNAMSSGATDPSYAGVITAMGDDQYHTMAVGLCDATVVGLFITEGERRWGPLVAAEGQAFAAKYDTRANLTTLGNGFNSFAATVVGAEKSALLPFPWELSAAIAAVSAVQAQADPSRAMSGIKLPGFSGAERGSRFSYADRNILLSDGISTVRTSPSGDLLIDKLNSTWQTNAAGLPDPSYRDLVTPRLLAALRYSVIARMSSKFPRFKLKSTGPIPAGQPIVTPDIIRSEMLALFKEWEGLGWVENFAQFKDEIIVERNGSDVNRVDMVLPPDMINNLLVTAVKLSFIR